MNIKELINNYKKNNFNYNITEDELNAFVKEFVVINSLKNKYNNGECNRKKLGYEIFSRVENLKRLIAIFERGMVQGINNYEYPDYISDCELALNLLLELSNKGTKEYVLKKFYADQLGSIETVHGDRQSGMFHGEIFVIGEKKEIENIDNSKPYYGDSFGVLISEIINNGNSIAIITNHYYENNVMPTSITTMPNINKFKVSGLISELYCYTYDDELNKAVSNLKEYIDTYGGDIDNLSINTLITRIEELNVINENNQQKVLKKSK